MSQAFCQITETPGVGATREQLSMLSTRYGLAVKVVGAGPVLEVACGTGIGLGILAQSGGKVVGNDIDQENIRIATATWSADSRITIDWGDVAKLPYEEASFSGVVCFEALYYFPDLSLALGEMVRVLRPGGALILCSVNPSWSGFNRSPFSVGYPTPASLTPMLDRLNCSVEVFGGFVDKPSGLMSKIISGVRRLAVKLRIIPRSMRGKELLKKLFLGGTVPMPAQLVSGTVPSEPLTQLPSDIETAPFKVFYFVAKKGL